MPGSWGKRKLINSPQIPADPLYNKCRWPFIKKKATRSLYSWIKHIQNKRHRPLNHSSYMGLWTREHTQFSSQASDLHPKTEQTKLYKLFGNSHQESCYWKISQGSFNECWDGTVCLWLILTQQTQLCPCGTGRNWASKHWAKDKTYL